MLTDPAVEQIYDQFSSSYMLAGLCPILKQVSHIEMLMGA